MGGTDDLAKRGVRALTPTPASNSLTVALDMAGAPTGTLTFLDMTGRSVYSQAVYANEEQLHFDLGKMGLTSGVYLVRLKHANGPRVERMVGRCGRKRAKYHGGQERDAASMHVENKW